MKKKQENKQQNKPTIKKKILQKKKSAKKGPKSTLPALVVRKKELHLQTWKFAHWQHETESQKETYKKIKNQSKRKQRELEKIF